MPLRRLAAFALLPLAACGEASVPAPAQEQAAVPDAPPPVPPGGPRTATHGGPDPGESHLMTRYGISAEEAAMRLRAEEHVSALARALRRDPVHGFSDLWIEHAPAYAVVLAFKHPPDREAILRRAHPDLRPHIVFRSSARSRAEIERDSDRVIAAMRGAPGQWAGGYDVRTGRFVYEATGPATIAYAERHLPADLRDDVTFRVGSVPVPQVRRPVPPAPGGE